MIQLVPFHMPGSGEFTGFRRMTVEISYDAIKINKDMDAFPHGWTGEMLIGGFLHQGVTRSGSAFGAGLRRRWRYISRGDDTKFDEIGPKKMPISIA